MKQPELRPGRVVHRSSSKGVSRVVQSGVRDASVQRQVEAAQKGRLPLVAGSREPIYQDFTLPEYRDFHESMNTVNRVKFHFSTLPAVDRARFRNDPVLFAKYLDDPAHQEMMVKLGYKEAPKPPKASEEAPKAPKPPKASEEAPKAPKPPKASEDAE